MQRAPRTSVRRCSFLLTTRRCRRESLLFLGCRYSEREIEIAGKGCYRRAALGILKHLSVVVARIAAVNESLDDPGLRAVARTGELDGVLQRRVRSADGVLIELVRYLIEDREVRAVPLHRAGKLRRVARGDLFEGAAAFRKLDQTEVGTITFEAIGEEISLVVVTVEELFIQRRGVNGTRAASVFEDHHLAAALPR